MDNRFASGMNLEASDCPIWESAYTRIYLDQLAMFIYSISVKRLIDPHFPVA